MTEWLHFHFSLSCIGEGNGNPFQCSCLENPRDGGAWWAAISGVTQSQTWLKRLSSSSSSRHESAMGVHVSPCPELPPTSLAIPFLCVVPVHWLWVPCFMHWTWTGHLFHIWQYTCFNAIISNHPTLRFSHNVQNSILYICVAFAVLHIGLSLPSF